MTEPSYVVGADFSQHQGKVDWQGIKIAFAFIRATYGTYQDKRFAENWPAAKAAGVPRGAYLYYYPTVNAAEQAQKFIDVVGADWGELPSVIDVEEEKYGPVPKPWGPDLKAGLQTCIEMVAHQAGRQPLIYTNKGYWDAYLGNTSTFGCDLWVANWIKGGLTPQSRPLLPVTWRGEGYKVWQFTNEGQCSAVSSKYLDLDVCEESVLASLIRPQQTPEPAPAPTHPSDTSESLSQRDPRWKDVTLGFGDRTSTIGAYGCTLTCLTMAVNQLNGTSGTPDKLNELLKALGPGVGYTGKTGNLMVFGALSKAVSKILLRVKLSNFIRCRDVPAPMDVIDAALDAGKAVVVELDFSPAPGLQNHWVLIHGRQGGDYLIYDPWPVPAVGSELLSKYAQKPEWTAARIITSVVIYSKE